MFFSLNTTMHIFLMSCPCASLLYDCLMILPCLYVPFCAINHALWRVYVCIASSRVYCIWSCHFVTGSRKVRITFLNAYMGHVLPTVTSKKRWSSGLASLQELGQLMGQLQRQAFHKTYGKIWDLAMVEVSVKAIASFTQYYDHPFPCFPVRL